MARGDSLGDLEQLVMVAILRLGDNAYGAAIRQELENRAGRIVTGGSVYATLQRLEEKGYVSSRLGEPLPERGGRARTYFKIEAPGMKALQHTYSALKSMAAGVKVLPHLS
jgi:PadR family transcriptional regulator PadR